MSDYDSMARDAAYDNYMDSLYEEHKGMAIEEFRAERLQSYFRSHPDVGKDVLAVLNEARSLLRDHIAAALVFASSAIELGMKLLFMKPIVAGLVHPESTADLIAELTISHSGNNRFRDLLFAIAVEHGGVDLSAHHRGGIAPSLWQEIRDIKVARDRILHQGTAPAVAEPARAVDVAAYLIEELFPKLVDRLGLHTHKDLMVCDDYHGP